MYYRLVDKVVTPCTDEEWSRLFESKDRILAQENVNGLEVSTVFIGLAQGFWEQEPLVFETMIFGDVPIGYQVRYCTWDQAVEGHLRAVKYAFEYKGPLA